MEKLNHPYAVAITVYSLAVCLPKETDHSASWEKLTALATRGRSNGNNRPELLTRITQISFRLDVYLSNILLASPLSCMCARNRLERFLISRGKWLLPVDDWLKPGQSEGGHSHYSRQHVLRPSSCSETWEDWVFRPNSLLANHPGKLSRRFQIVSGDEEPEIHSTTSETFWHVLLVQDTLNALDALAEYSLTKSAPPEVNAVAEFTVQGRNDVIQLELENRKSRVETNLKVPITIQNVLC